MIAAGGIGVHLLNEIIIRHLILERLGNEREILVQPLLGPGPGFRSAIHEEAIIVLIGPEAYVIGHHGVGNVRLGRGCGSALGCKSEIVLNAVIVQKHIGHIAQNQDHESQQYTAGDLQSFFHRNLLRSG